MHLQKFQRGDVVRIAKDLGSSMAHFENDQDAIVMGSYADQYGGDNVDDWTVMLSRTGGETSWYHTRQLALLWHGGESEIQRVKFERSKREATQKDINWIVANWLTIRETPPAAIMARLMELIGITNPSGFHGEGLVYYSNMMATYNLLDPILSTGDIEQFNDFLKHLHERKRI